MRHDAPLASATSLHRHRLPNGLEAWLWHEPDHPVATHLSFFRVGSRDETPGRTGLAHFLEHMMFKGSRRHPEGAFDALLTAAGCSNNAWTSNDFTVYTDDFPVAAWETVLDLESDRLTGLVLDPASLERERQVVLSERRLRVDDDPLAFFAEQAQLVAAAGSPYAHPVIGWREDIAAWRADDVLAFYRRHYRPSRTLVVTAGGVAPEAWREGLERHYGPLADPGDGTPEEPPYPPPLAGRREYTLRRPAESAALAVGLPLPPAGDGSGEPLLALLLTLLAGGASARLHERLVEEEALATSVAVYPVGRRGPGWLWIEALATDPRATGRLEKRLLEECERLASEGPEDDELARARLLAATRHHRELVTTSGRALALGQSVLLTGDDRLVHEWTARLEAVDGEGLRTFFAALLDAPGRTHARLLPEGVP